MNATAKSRNRDRTLRYSLFPMDNFLPLHEGLSIEVIAEPQSGHEVVGVEAELLAESGNVHVHRAVGNNHVHRPDLPN